MSFIEKKKPVSVGSADGVFLFAIPAIVSILLWLEPLVLHEPEKFIKCSVRKGNWMTTEVSYPKFISQWQNGVSELNPV